MNKTSIEEIKEKELDVYDSDSIRYYFWQLLVGEMTLEEAIDNVKGFRNTEHYRGSEEQYLQPKGGKDE